MNSLRKMYNQYMINIEKTNDEFRNVNAGIVFKAFQFDTQEVDLIANNFTYVLFFNLVAREDYQNIRNKRFFDEFIDDMKEKYEDMLSYYEGQIRFGHQPNTIFLKVDVLRKWLEELYPNIQLSVSDSTLAFVVKFLNKRVVSFNSLMEKLDVFQSNYQVLCAYLINDFLRLKNEESRIGSFLDSPILD